MVYYLKEMEAVYKIKALPQHRIRSHQDPLTPFLVDHLSQIILTPPRSLPKENFHFILFCNLNQEEIDITNVPLNRLTYVLSFAKCSSVLNLLDSLETPRGRIVAKVLQVVAPRHI